MTDHLTEAVRRLRQLQEDVERLKQARNGEIRELRSVSDTAVCDDDVAIGADAAVDERTVTADAATTGADAAVDETAGCDDTVSVAETVASNIAEYDTSSYDDGSTYG